MRPDTLFAGVRLIDPASGLDRVGDLLVRDGLIADLGPGLGKPDGAIVVCADSAVLCPGLVDMRAELGEPGFEYRETIASAAAAAAAGGITTVAALPNTLPAIDDPALVRLLRARGEEAGSLTILPFGAVTRGCRGEELAELGLLAEAGAVAFTDGSRALGTARLMRLALSYASGFDRMIVQPMVDGLGEALIGYRINPDVGPLVMVAAGGIMTEIYRDRSLRLAPVDLAEAHAMISEVRALRALAGVRGKLPADLSALARAIVALSQLATNESVIEAEINPLILLPRDEGVIAVDALVRVREKR